VVLEGVADPTKKIGILRAVREATGLSLVEVRDVVESAPRPVKKGLSAADAEALRKKLEDAGARVKLEPE
jgi:large subunit ribosomal protein L7/L12